MLHHMLRAAAQRAFNVLDPYFQYVTMLLHGDGTNGAQNNTFLDSSTNNFTITRNGNTTQGTFSPYGSNWSNYFNNATPDYLSVAYNSAFDVAGGTFTIECWVCVTGLFTPNTDGNRVGAIAEFGPSTIAIGWEFLIDQTNNLLLFGTPGANNRFICTYTFTQGVFYHIAVVRNGSANAIYINGVSQTLTTNNYTGGSATSGSLTIGTARRFGGYNQDYLGYVSNFRLVKGSAVYTSNFTPSTTPLTAITNTQLLTCQSNRFVDNSSNAFAITTSGTPSVQRFSPFSPTSAYSTSVIGGSGYFDGSGDYLTAPNNTAFLFGSGDFCIEFWAYFNRASGTSSIPIAIWDGISSTPQAWVAAVSTGGNLVFAINTSAVGGNVSIFAGSTNEILNNTWYHIAFTRSGNTWRKFVNGVIAESTTNSSTIYAGTSPLYIGSYQNKVVGDTAFLGTMGDVRIVKGSAVYTSAFTPPTAPLTAITNTSLLLSYTNAGILDNAMMNDLETVGNAQISTSVKKYGTGSIAFDGTGDWLFSPKTADMVIPASSTFTMECWAYLTAAQNTFRMLVSEANGSSSRYLSINATGIEAQFGGSSGTSVAANYTFTLNTWYHIALVRNGTTVAIYINGQAQTVSNSTQTNAFFDVGTGMYIGRWGGSPSYEWSGYIDDLRITKGVARYTANFTPPTAAFPNN